MKYLLLFFILAFFSCSDEPVNMEEVLFERGGQYITADNFSPYFFFNQKVYNGPAYTKYRTGEKREQGILKNGFKSGSWTGWDKKGNKRFIGEYKEGKEDGAWVGFHPSGEKNMKENTQMGSKQETGFILIKRVKKNWKSLTLN